MTIEKADLDKMEERAKRLNIHPRELLDVWILGWAAAGIENEKLLKKIEALQAELGVQDAELIVLSGQASQKDPEIASLRAEIEKSRHEMKKGYIEELNRLSEEFTRQKEAAKGLVEAAMKALKWGGEDAAGLEEVLSKYQDLLQGDQPNG